MYFPARSGGIVRPARGRRAEAPPAGGPSREPAGSGRLLVVERGPVHVAGLPVGLAAEAQDGRVVDQAVGDGDGLRRGTGETRSSS
jgi:hypothetical protein